MVNFPRDPRRGLFEVDAYSWLCLDSRGVELPGCSREHNPPQSSTQESFCSPAGRKLSTERMTEPWWDLFLRMLTVEVPLRCLQPPPKSACNMWNGFIINQDLQFERDLIQRSRFCKFKTGFTPRSLRQGCVSGVIALVLWCGKHVTPYLRERACLSCYCRKVICQERAVLACCIPLLRS